MDELFVGKVFRTVLYTWALAMVWALVLGRPWIALSISLGMALGAAVLATYNHVIRKVFVPGSEKPGRALLKLAFVKYPLIGLGLYLIVRWQKIDLIAFCGGLVLVHFAILAKLAGIKIAEGRKRRREES